MSVNAKLLADFSSFETATDKSIFKLREFALEPAKVERALNRMVEDFSGAKIVQQALLAADAVEQIGGASKLTEVELQRVARQASEASAKLRLMGEEVPEKLATLSRHLAPVPEQLTLTQRAAAFASSTFAQMSSSFAFVTLLDRGVSALFQFGRAAIEAAGKTVDLADKLGFSTETIERMDHVAQQTGTTVDALGNAAFRLQTKWESSRKAVNDLGVSWQELSNVSPEAKFTAVVDALGRMSNAEERNRAGFAIFGRQFGEIAPAVAAGYAKIAAEAKTTGDAQVRALDSAADAWNRFKDVAGKSMTAALANTVMFADEQERVLERAIMPLAKWLGLIDEIKEVGVLDPVVPPAISPEALKGVSDYVAQLREARAETSTLTTEQIRQIAAAQELGTSTKDLAEEYGVSELAIKRLNEATQLQGELMGTTLVERATALLGALQSLEAQGLKPQKGAWDEIVTAMTSAQGVMLSTGKVGEAMYMQLEAAKRKFQGLTPDGLIPSSSPFQGLFTLPETMPSLQASTDEYIQATQAKIDAENRYQDEQKETERAIKEGILIIGETKDAHTSAGEAAAAATAMATRGYAGMKQQILESAAALKVAVPLMFDWVQAYKDAGFFIADPGALGSRPLDRSGWAPFGGGSSTTVQVDARESIFDGVSADALADRVSQALLARERSLGRAVGA